MCWVMTGSAWPDMTAADRSRSGSPLITPIGCSGSPPWSIPITEHLRRIDVKFATAWWHWFFFAQPDIPERVITADPDAGTAATPT